MTMTAEELVTAQKGYQETQLRTHSTMRVRKCLKKSFDAIRFGPIAKTYGLKKLTTNQMFEVLIEMYDDQLVRWYN